MVQGKDTLNKKQNLPCCHWCHGPLFFLHQFLHLVLLLLLHNSGKLAIPHGHMFLLIHILHLILFKSLQRQGDMIVSTDIPVIFWWAIDDNRHLSLLGRADIPFVWNGFVAIYFQPIFDCQFWKVVFLVMQQCSEDCVVFSGMSAPFKISSCASDLVDGAQYKCKIWFVFCAF